jgi:antitoxin VapB
MIDALVYIKVLTVCHWRWIMRTARLFINGRSQAVRLPKDCRFSGKEVYIKKLQGVVILIPKDDPWSSLVNSLDHFSHDFMDTREQPELQARDGL